MLFLCGQCAWIGAAQQPKDLDVVLRNDPDYWDVQFNKFNEWVHLSEENRKLGKAFSGYKADNNEAKNLYYWLNFADEGRKCWFGGFLKYMRDYLALEPQNPQPQEDLVPVVPHILQPEPQSQQPQPQQPQQPEPQAATAQPADQEIQGQVSQSQQLLQWGERIENYFWNVLDGGWRGILLKETFKGNKEDLYATMEGQVIWDEKGDWFDTYTGVGEYEKYLQNPQGYTLPLTLRPKPEQMNLEKISSQTQTQTLRHAFMQRLRTLSSVALQRGRAAASWSLSKFKRAGGLTRDKFRSMWIKFKEWRARRGGGQQQQYAVATAEATSSPFESQPQQ